MLSFYLSGFKRLFSIGKKVILVIAVYFIVIGLFMHFINKDKPRISQDPIQNNRAEIYKMVNDKELNKTKEGKMQIAMMRLTSCALIGEACTKNPVDGDKNFDKSMFGFISKLLVAPYSNPPASGVWWAYNGLQNAGFVPKTYAAEGIGFGAIKPFADIWSAFRNVAYLILVLVTITIGFMIMFRMKLNPQTVISIESALPKIIISLLLITFSFAIAGFLIDLMYIAIILIVSVMGPAAGLNSTQVMERQRDLIQANPGTLLNYVGSFDKWNRIIWDLPNALLNLIGEINIIVRVIGSIAGFVILFPFLSKHFPFENIIGFFHAHATTGVGVIWPGLAKLADIPANLAVLGIAVVLGATFFIPFILGLIIFLTVILIFFRILFLLLSTYIKILLTIIISPLYLLLEAVPGQSAFSGWLRNIVSELIIFPTIIAIFMLSTIIIKAIDTGKAIQFPFMFGINTADFSLLIGIAILFLTPDLVKAVKQMILPKPGLLDQGGIGVFFGGASAGIGGGLGELQKYAGLGYYIKPIGDLLQNIPGGKTLFADHSSSTTRAPKPGETP